MSFIEKQRNILEELDVLEHEITQRIKRNGEIVGNKEDGRKRPLKETLLQQHEVKYFIQKYKKQCKSFEDNRRDLKEMLEGENKVIQDDGSDFKVFDEMVEEIRKEGARDAEEQNKDDLYGLHEMFSSAPSTAMQMTKKAPRVKRRYILSAALAHIDLEKIFTAEENFGRFLDLRKFYEDYTRFSGEPKSYEQYLADYDIIPYTNVNRSSSEYRKYVAQLAQYLYEFISKSEPLLDTSALIKKIDDEYTKIIKKSNENNSSSDEHNIFCESCNKVFVKRTVYEAHLNGKKHLKNVKKFEGRTDKDNKEEIDHVTHDECKIRVLGQYLNSKKLNTIENTERRSALTDRERMLEDFELAGDESDYTTVGSAKSDMSENSSDESDTDIQNLPIGIDGRPIPFWLYKLQGYHKTYDCEICGNMTYKGRIPFLKHFAGSKHLHGLHCLGIDDESLPLFKDIVKIDEAMDLWRKLKKQRRIKEADMENAVEVEDEEGNVLSEKDYLELKRQGLL